MAELSTAICSGLSLLLCCTNYFLSTCVAGEKSLGGNFMVASVFFIIKLKSFPRQLRSFNSTSYLSGKGQFDAWD